LKSIEAAIVSILLTSLVAVAYMAPLPEPSMMVIGTLIWFRGGSWLRGG
jgi:hypothetical protein